MIALSVMKLARKPSRGKSSPGAPVCTAKPRCTIQTVFSQFGRPNQAGRAAGNSSEQASNHSDVVLAWKRPDLAAQLQFE